MSKNPELDKINQIQKDLKESHEIVAKAMGQAKALVNRQSYDIPVGQASPATSAVPSLALIISQLRIYFDGRLNLELRSFMTDTVW